MKGYKAFDEGMTCRGMKYEVGKTYKHNGKIGLCESGFHFCLKASDCANYYNHSQSEFAEIEATGKVVEGDDKCVTDEIVIVRKIEKSEFYALANDGKDNIGIKNTGDLNTGDLNTGDLNTGDRNTGDRNNTDRSTGFFCTKEQTVKLFDMETGKTYFQLSNKLPSVLLDIPFGNKFDGEKLIYYTAKDRQEFYDNLTESQKDSIKSIDFFDAEKFFKCTGIRV